MRFAILILFLALAPSLALAQFTARHHRRHHATPPVPSKVTPVVPVAPAVIPPSTPVVQPVAPPAYRVIRNRRVVPSGSPVRCVRG